MKEQIKHSIVDNLLPAATYSALRTCAVVDDGRQVVFQMPSMVRYIVDADYARLWYEDPRLLEMDFRRRIPSPRSPVRVVGAQLTHRLFRLRYRRHGRWCNENVFPSVVVEFSDGHVTEISWERVLICSEPAYEFYGGLYRELKSFISGWEKAGRALPKRVLREDDIDESNFGTFAGCRILASGNSVEFMMPSADRYELPVRKLLRHLGSDSGRARAGVPMQKFRALQSRTLLRLYAIDGAHMDVSARDIVRICDARYTERETGGRD